jgi:enoyl-CoA hydratase/carnithine racemase
MIGIDRQQTKNRIDPPVLIGLGKAYYELDHDGSLRVAVLHGVGPDFVIEFDVAAFAAATAAGHPAAQGSGLHQSRWYRSAAAEAGCRCGAGSHQYRRT